MASDETEVSVALDARRERLLGTITPSMQRYDAELAADWHDAVKRQVCPFCGAGPFTVVALHVNKIHGVNKKAFRDMLGVFYHEPICDQTYSRARSTIMRQLIQAGRVPIFGDTDPHQHGPHQLSVALRQKHSEPSVQPRHLAESNARRRKRFEAAMVEAVERFNAGESIQTLAAEAGVSVNNMRKRLRMVGVSLPPRQGARTGAGPWCGTIGGYSNHGCRCEACTAANREAQRRYRERKRTGLAN